MRWLILLLLAGCNEGALSPNQNNQGEFCKGSAQIELNGTLSTTPAVMVMPLFLDCCEAATISFVTAKLQNSVSLQWRAQVGAQPNVPTTIDVAKPPAGWGVWLASDCNDLLQCSDTLMDGLTGSLTVTGDFNVGFTTSACITAKETAPHPILHSVRLWLPNAM